MQPYLIIVALLGVLTNVQAKTVRLENYPDRPIIEKESNKASDKLIILLHPIRTSAQFVNLYYPLASFVNEYNFNLIIPSGSKNSKGKRYWNTSEDCCNVYNEKANDLLFLDELITHYQKKYGSKKIYLVGHSNGAFMANFYACHGRHPIQGFFSFAGNPSGPLKNCRMFSNIKVIQAHGQKDTYVPYFGGRLRHRDRYSIPVKTYLADYQNSLQCSDLEFVTKKNLTLTRLGKDFDIFQSEKCSSGNELIFWDHFNGGHIPRFKRQYFRDIIEALLLTRNQMAL